MLMTVEQLEVWATKNKAKLPNRGNDMKMIITKLRNQQAGDATRRAAKAASSGGGRGPGSGSGRKASQPPSYSDDDSEGEGEGMDVDAGSGAAARRPQQQQQHGGRITELERVVQGGRQTVQRHDARLQALESAKAALERENRQLGSRLAAAELRLASERERGQDLEQQLAERGDAWERRLGQLDEQVRELLARPDPGTALSAAAVSGRGEKRPMEQQQQSRGELRLAEPRKRAD